MTTSSEQPSPACMTFAIDPDTSGPTLKPVEATFTRLGPKKLRVLVTFTDPVMESVWPEVKFGLLLVGRRAGRTIAIHIQESGLWKDKWNAHSTETTWSMDRRKLRVELTLPIKYESIPDRPPRTFTSFREGWWPFMTKAQWIQALDHRGRL